MKKQDYFQHGDLLLKKIDKIPDGAVEKKSDIILSGEHTNHHHRIARNAQAVILVLGAIQYLRVFDDTPITHEEHKERILPPGDYEIDQVREFDHFKEEAKRVID